MVRTLVCTLFCAAFLARATLAQEMKSSFQPGDKAPGFEAHVATGEFAGQKLDYMAKIKDKPVLFLAVNRVTRPGHGLLAICDKYGQHRKDDGGLQTVILRLTDDADKAIEYSKLLEEKYGIKCVGLVSADGPNGPPAWGFNPDVELTILVMDKKHTVTANFSLVSPERQDFRKVRQAIDKLLGEAKTEFNP
jgi:hypothetical protein